MTKKGKKSLELIEPILVRTFGLTRLFDETPLLKEWLGATGSLSEMDMALLGESLKKLIKNADSWNEEELKMQFISFIIFLARFDDPIRTYYDREINEFIGDVFLNCKSDMMLSKGIGELIETPYFFLHEYKREKKYSGDPVGQMLGGMLIGQARNDNNKPIYGCYVQGRFWFFSVLEGDKYVISHSFDSSEEDDAKRIIFILRKLKEIISLRLM
ncbi:MAG: hypothetical protein U5N85_11640 [Arcicella sp.]|nr:hypothetical protein [Arcicella sp.]